MTTLAYDAVVLGAGSAGCCAAIAAARSGARTLLVDRLGFPGGTSTAVLDTFYAFFTSGPDPRKVVAGLPDEPVERLRLRGKVRERPNSFGSGTGLTYDPETLKFVWAELLTEAGVDVMLHTFFLDAVTDDDGTVRAVDLASKAGRVRVGARAFVDATGDADVVTAAGGQALTDTERQQAATTTFRMAPVDGDRFMAEGRAHLVELVRSARLQGYDLPGDGGSLHLSGNDGVVLTALTRLRPPDLSDPLEPGRLEMDGLAQTDTWARFLRDRMPGFERAEVTAVSPMAGVRETRRIAGRKVLTADDVVSATRFDDEVALCGAPVEDLSDTTTRWGYVRDHGAYGIPWRCLVPAAVRGVVVAGRCLSARHDAHASARSMATCMALGQAAGTAAGLAVAAAGEDITDVDAEALRRTLTAHGACLEDA